jgi:hypothetical protein
MKRNWCHVCRGGREGDSDRLVKCSTCARRFHRECCNAPKAVTGCPAPSWSCPDCVEDAQQGPADRAAEKAFKLAVKQRVSAVRACHRQLKARSSLYSLGSETY